MRPGWCGAFTRRWALALVAMGLVAWPVGASASTGEGAVVPAVTAGSRYLALGDSVTFGYEEGSVVPAPDYHHAASFLGYPEQLAAELHLKVANAACPGETSASLINASALSNGCENGYRRAFPLHVRYPGSQLAYALRYLHTHHGVALVSLMIGANDGLLCVEHTPDHCASAAEMKAVAQKVTGNVHRILQALRGKAHYRGQLVIVNYYSPFKGYNTRTIALNQTIDAAAKPFHVVVADGFGAFQRADRQSAGDPCTAGLLTQEGSPGTCGIHPSYAGQALLAQAVERAIRL